MGNLFSKNRRVQAINDKSVQINEKMYYSDDYVQSLHKNLEQQLEDVKNELHQSKVLLSCKEEESKKLKMKQEINIQEINQYCIAINEQCYYTKEYLELVLQSKQQQYEEILSHRRNSMSDLEKQVLQIKSENLFLQNSNKILEIKLQKQTSDNSDNLSNAYQQYNEKLRQMLLKKEQDERDYQQKIVALEDTLENRNVQIERLNRDNKALVEENTQLQLNLRNERFRLEENYRQMKKAIDKYQEKDHQQERKHDIIQGSPKSDQNDYVNKALQIIQKVENEVEIINKQVVQFSGARNDRTFLHLKELLIRSVVTLDNVETNGFSIIRDHRKLVIKSIQEVLDKLNNL